MTGRQAIEEAGVEALQRLHEVAIRRSGQSRMVTGFLLSLYIGRRFPFDLTDLRGLDDALFQDCVALLRMDARVTAREVRTYFATRGRTFEALAIHWSLEDVEQVREPAQGLRQ